MIDHQPYSRGRTWTFSVLPRDVPYRLWFDPDSNRWEVAQLHGDGGPLRLREKPARRSKGGEDQ